MSLQSFLSSQQFKRQSPNLRKLGFDFNNSYPEEEYFKIQSFLYSEYHIRCESMLSIMKKFNIPSTRTMDILFKHFDIQPRSFNEATINAIEQNRSNPFSNSHNFVTIDHNTWDDRKVILRSSYEKDLAVILDNQKIRYEVETLRIKYFDKTQKTFRIAIPDFYLPSTNTIIEVKSTYWLDEQNMLSKKAAYLDLGFNFKLYLDHIMYENWSSTD